MSELSQRIAKANRENLSTREVVRRAAKDGIRVSHGTIANILRGSHGTPSDNTLRALESVFRISFAELRKTVGLSSTSEPWVPPEDAARLTPKQRRLVESLIHELVRPAPKHVTVSQEHGQVPPSIADGRRPAPQPKPAPRRVPQS